MVKLFRAYSVRENYKNRDSVVVDWFCIKREEPRTINNEILQGFVNLDEKLLKLAKGRLDTLLDDDEVGSLQDYIWSNFSFDVKTKELPLPFFDVHSVPDFSVPSQDDQNPEYFHIYQNERYNLSISISGYVDLSEPPNLISSVN